MTTGDFDLNPGIRPAEPTVSIRRQDSTANREAIHRHLRRIFEPGGLLVRFLARLIDGIIVGVVSLVLAFS